MTSLSALQTGTELVTPLGRLAQTDLAQAGGKAANLGELIRAGMPVPPGFAVTTAAYDRFVNDNALHTVIAQTLRKQGQRAADQPVDGSAIRNAFEQAPIPPDVKERILDGYRALGECPVAVRSSATAEDLPQAAFAGQQDTYLNVVGADALLDAVRSCWASLWTDRAIAYRTRLGFHENTQDDPVPLPEDATDNNQHLLEDASDPNQHLLEDASGNYMWEVSAGQPAVKIAVVVQSMVEAESAGVLFTANTVTGARNEIVIDASPGLGEAVVSGQVTPDHYVLRKQWWRWRIVERHAGHREVIVRGRAGGGVEHIEGAETGTAPALPDPALRQLATLGIAIAQHFGRPQDVEWAWAGGQPYILQARPITALAEPPPKPSRPMRMLAAVFAEIMPARPYPLENSTWGPDYLVSTLLRPMFETLGLSIRIDRMLVVEDGVVVRMTDYFPLRPSAGLLLAPLRLWRLARRYDAAHWRADPLVAKIHECVQELEARNLSNASWSALLDTVQDALAIPPLAGELRVRYVLPSMPVVGRFRLLLSALGQGEHFGALLFTGIESRTMDANRALEELADQVRANTELAALFARQEASPLWTTLQTLPAAQNFLHQLRTFLDEYGHRETGGTLQVSEPTWRAAPQAVIGILQGLVASPDPIGNTKHARENNPAWQIARDRVLTHPLLRIPPLRAAFLRLLTRARRFPQIREDTRFYATLVLPVLRETLLELGRRLAGAGVLASAEDVFHLQFEELEQLQGAWPPSDPQTADLRARVERRRARRKELASTPVVDPRLLQPPTTDSHALAGALVRGIPGSPGVSEGPVRVIHDASEFGKLRAGDVLVTAYTNPAWTPLFQVAVAVVVDTGGPGSHAAIVAREYGIPAVMGTVTGTQTLRDGLAVRVDGSQGAVFPTSPGQA